MNIKDLDAEDVAFDKDFLKFSLLRDLEQLKTEETYAEDEEIADMVFKAYPKETLRSIINYLNKLIND